MKTQRIVKSGAAIGGAVALLLISALFAPSPALAGSAMIKDSCRLIASDLERHASGQARLTGTIYAGWGNYSYSASVTVSCKGLTPGKGYYLEIGDAYGYSTWDYGVASPTGGLVLVGGSEGVFPSFIYVSVYSDAGQVLGGSLSAVW